MTTLTIRTEIIIENDRSFVLMIDQSEIMAKRLIMIKRLYRSIIPVLLVMYKSGYTYSKEWHVLWRAERN